MNESCGKTMVARFVSCDFWNDKRAIVHNAIALFLQKAWRIRNAYNLVLMTLMLLMVCIRLHEARGRWH